MAKSRHYYIRKSHRYLGLILGIQFLMWTISGLYFSWTDLDEIHGDFQRKHPAHLAGAFKLISPDSVFIKLNTTVDSIHSIQLVSILGKPYYNVQFFAGNTFLKLLADATTAERRPAITRDESMLIAAESFNGNPKVRSVAYITTTTRHHEYREKPLPAWAVTFDHPTNTTVYVSAEAGKVESFRNNKWRVFDFLWMGHTMDYQAIEERWLQLHPQVVIERDKFLRRLGKETAGELESWLSQLAALNDEWIIERRVQLLMDRGQYVDAKYLLLQTRFQKMNQTYARTSLYLQLCEKLNLPFDTIPAQLGDDRLALFGAYRRIRINHCSILFYSGAFLPFHFRVPPNENQLRRFSSGNTGHSSAVRF